jgi:hypothetical protein
VHQAHRAGPQRRRALLSLLPAQRLTLRTPALFPPAPRALKGRAAELATLTHLIETAAPTRLALVGSGGSGKSILAAALGHRLARRFPGGIHWFRVGQWDPQTLLEMFALRFGTARAREVRVESLRSFFRENGPRLIVLDNHEDDRATARLLDALAGVGVRFVITARRCLLSGVLIYPVTDLVDEYDSYETFAEGFYLTRPLMRWFKGNYCETDDQRLDPRASPLRATSLAGLPPAFVMTAGYDPLRDEGKKYAQLLLEAGVDVEYRNYDSLIHGFVSMAGVVREAGRAFDDAVAALRIGLGVDR